jgi:serine/threonine-protein kinase Chk1
MSAVHATLEALGVSCRSAPPSDETLKLRIGGQDQRKEVFRGWVEIESFVYHGAHGSFCVMKKDNVRFTIIISCLGSF